MNRAFQLGLQKRAAAQKGKGNIAGTLKNVVSLASFLTQFLKTGTVQLVPLIQYTVDGVANGFGKGMQQGGLLKALTHALSKGTDGTARGGIQDFGKTEASLTKL